MMTRFLHRPRVARALVPLTPFFLAVIAAAPSSAQAPPPGSPQTEIVREIARLDSLWLNAYLTRDVEVVRGILSDDFQGQLAGTLATKATILDRVAQSTVTSMELDRLVVNVFGDIAVAHALRRSTALVDGVPTESAFAYTDVYQWREGRWVSFTGQSAPL